MKAGSLYKKIQALGSEQQAWLLGNDTDDALRHGFDRKRVVHPGQGGTPIAPHQRLPVWNDLLLHKKEIAPRAVYIHIPFCSSKCLYCGFFQNISQTELIDRYTAALIKEISYDADKIGVQSQPINAVYFGGGTPSALSCDNIRDLLGAVKTMLPLAADCELTFESRIHDLTDEKIAACLAGGINRFSIGIQSFNTQVRKSIGRIDSRGVIQERLQKIAALNQAAVVIDLMYGLPYQTASIWEDDIMTQFDSGIHGGDMYQLNVFENSELKQAMLKGKIPASMSTSEQALLFAKAIEIVKHKPAVHRLSICHWSVNSRERNVYNYLSKSGCDILPYGSGAGGALSGYSAMNERDLTAYLQRINSGEKSIAFVMRQAEGSAFDYAVSSQMDRGYMDGYEVKKRWGIDHVELLEPLLREWQRRGLVEIDGSVVTMTIAGQFWYVNLTQAALDCLSMLRSERPQQIKQEAIAAQG
jgi:putative heme utilization radical SAM enzyme HutW